MFYNIKHRNIAFLFEFLITLYYILLLQKGYVVKLLKMTIGILFTILWQNYSLIASVIEFEEQQFYPSEITSKNFSAMDTDELDLQKSPEKLQPILLKKSRINNTQRGKGKQLQYFDLDDQGQPNGRSLIVHQHEYAIDSDARMDSLAEQRGKEIRASFYRYTTNPGAKVIRRDGRSYKNALSTEQIQNYKKMRKNDGMILRVQRRLSEIRNQKYSNNYQIFELNKLIDANQDKKATLLERIAWSRSHNNNE